METCTEVRDKTPVRSRPRSLSIGTRKTVSLIRPQNMDTGVIVALPGASGKRNADVERMTQRSTRRRAKSSSASTTSSARQAKISPPSHTPPAVSPPPTVPTSRRPPQRRSVPSTASCAPESVSKPLSPPPSLHTSPDTTASAPASAFAGAPSSTLNDSDSVITGISAERPVPPPRRRHLRTSSQTQLGVPSSQRVERAASASIVQDSVDDSDDLPPPISPRAGSLRRSAPNTSSLPCLRRAPPIPQYMQVEIQKQKIKALGSKAMDVIPVDADDDLLVDFLPARLPLPGAETPHSPAAPIIPTTTTTTTTTTATTSSSAATSALATQPTPAFKAIPAHQSQPPLLTHPSSAPASPATTSPPILCNLMRPPPPPRKSALPTPRQELSTSHHAAMALAASAAPPALPPKSPLTRVRALELKRARAHSMA